MLWEIRNNHQWQRPPSPKKKKRIRRVLLTTCNKSLPCVQPPPPLEQNRGKGPSPRFQGYFFKIPRRRRQRERQKSNTLNRQKNNCACFFHAFLYISLPSLHDYDVKMPNITFYRGRKQATTKFSFFIWTWIWLFGIRLRESSLAFDKVGELN